MSRLSVLLGLCLAAVAVTTAQDGQQSDPQQPTFRIETRTVRVDLYATRDGQPVTDLRRDEVELFEDNAAQTIDTFERITYAPRSGAPAVEPRTIDDSRRLATDRNSRLFVLFLPTRDVAYAMGPRQLQFPVARQLNELLGPDDLVAVMTPYTRIADLAWARRLPLNNTTLFSETYIDPKHALWDACYPPTLPGSPNREMKARHQELMTFEALDALVAHLGSLREERKHILLMTGGFRLYTKNGSLGAGMRSGFEGVPPISGPGRPLGTQPRLGDGFGTPMSPRHCEQDLSDLASLDHSNRLDEIAAHAARTNVSFHPISPGGLSSTRTRAAYRAPYANTTLLDMQSGLRGLADDTGGMAIVNTNNVEQLLGRIMTTTSAYYLLGYTSTNTALDGRFRRISVKVKRPNTSVRARPGYVALTARNLRPEEPVAVSRRNDPVYAAVSAMATTHLRLVHVRVSTWVRDSGSDAPVLWIVAEPDQYSGSKAAWAKGGLAEMTLRPVGGGAVISRRVEIAPGSSVAEFELLDGGAPLKPGQYSVQLQLSAINGQPIGDFARVTVPADRASLGEAVLYRRSTATGQRYTRTADPRFRRNDRLRLELPTSASEPAAARLRDNRGAALQVPLQAAQRDDATGAFRWVVVDVPLTPLAPADYAVEVTQGSVSRIAAFRVVP